MAEAPRILLEHHLKRLKLPTFLREYEKLARQCAAEGLDHVRFLGRLVELELIDRERHLVERRIKQAGFPVVKQLESFDFSYHRVGAKSAWSAAAPPDRTGTRSSPMPDGEELAALARSGATLAIHLSIRSIAAVCDALAPLYGADCPAAVVYRASWPDERIVAGTLGDLAEKVRPLRFRRTALILVGRVLGAETFDESALYDAAHDHLLRPRKKRRAR